MGEEVMRQFSRNACCLASVTIFTFLPLSLLVAACGDFTPTVPPTALPAQTPGSTAGTTLATQGTAPATTTPPVYSGLQKGKLKEMYPVLAGLAGAKSFWINDDWDGLSQVAPTSAHYTLELKANQYDGEAIFSIAGRSFVDFYYQEILETARNITIPLAEARKFLQMLAEAPVYDGAYNGSPIATHTDDYPSLTISIDTGYGILQVFSRSQLDNFFPFSFSFAGKQFTGTDAAAFDAFKVLKPYLQKQLIADLIKRFDSLAKNRPNIQAPPLNPVYPSLITQDKNFSFNFQGDNSYSAFALSPDNKTIALGAYKKGVNLYNAIDGKPLKTLTVQDSSITSLSFSPDGQFLAGSGSIYDKTSYKNDLFTWVWDTQSKTSDPIMVIKGYTSDVISIAFSPDGKTLATAGNDRIIRLWELPSGRLIRQLKGSIPEFFKIYTLAFSPDGKTLAGAGGGDGLTGNYPVKFWDIATGNELTSLKGHTDLVRSLVFSPDGKKLATAGNEGTIRLWDLTENKELATLNTQTSRGFISSLEFTPDGKRVISAHQNGLVVIWDVDSANEISETVVQQGKDPFYGFNMSLSRDGKFIIIASKMEKTISRWLLK
jgi:WD40 repeat protein